MLTCFTHGLVLLCGPNAAQSPIEGEYEAATVFCTARLRVAAFWRISDGKKLLENVNKKTILRRSGSSGDTHDVTSASNCHNKTRYRHNLHNKTADILNVIRTGRPLQDP